MLSPEGVIYNVLKADASVTAICSTRIFPGPIPQPRPIPAVIHWRIDRIPIYVFGTTKRADLIGFRFRIIPCASTHAEVVSLHAAVADAFTKFKGITKVSDGLSPEQSIMVESISELEGDISSFNDALSVWEINSTVQINCYIPIPS